MELPESTPKTILYDKKTPPPCRSKRRRKTHAVPLLFISRPSWIKPGDALKTDTGHRTLYPPAVTVRLRLCLLLIQKRTGGSACCSEASSNLFGSCLAPAGSSLLEAEFPVTGFQSSRFGCNYIRFVNFCQ